MTMDGRSAFRGRPGARVSKLPPARTADGAPDVRWASPLLVALARAEKLDLADVVRRLPAPPAPPRGDAATGDARLADLLGDSPALVRAHYAARSGFSLEALWFARHRRAGVVLRDFDHPAGRLGVTLADNSLEMEVGLGSATLTTQPGSAALMLEGPLPISLVEALPGLAVGDLVGHPLFEAEPYRIRRAMTFRRGRLVRIEFATRSALYPVPGSSFGGDPS